MASGEVHLLWWVDGCRTPSFTTLDKHYIRPFFTAQNEEGEGDGRSSEGESAPTERLGMGWGWGWNGGHYRSYLVGQNVTLGKVSY